MSEEMFTIEEAAEQIRVFAEGTAKHSQNWDNFREIAKSMLEGAVKAARQKALDECLKLADIHWGTEVVVQAIHNLIDSTERNITLDTPTPPA